MEYCAVKEGTETNWSTLWGTISMETTFFVSVFLHPSKGIGFGAGTAAILDILHILYASWAEVKINMC